MKHISKLRLLGYYHYPNQDMKPEESCILEALELAPLLETSINSIYQNPETDTYIKDMISSPTVFIFKDEDNNLYGYFTSNKSVRITDVKYNKSAIEQIPFKYKAWFMPGKRIKLIPKKNEEPKATLLPQTTNIKSMDNKQEILSPDVNADAMNEVFDQMYITNVEKRLRELNAPTDIDKKRWIWELIQNAKDTIALDPNRDEINVRIEIDGDCVKFKHDGAPFTAKARYGLLYKYSGGKENQESTGRFGTGFLTTHCLSKIVTIESNMYSNKDCTELCGFEVTMYRDGLISSELIEGLRKMRASEKFFKQTFGWTTFTYHINSDSGRTAVKLGVENFHENIAPTMLFCKELSSIELNDNGSVTKIKKLPQVCLSENIYLAEYEIESPGSTYKRRFLLSHYVGISKELSERYRKERKLRLDIALEIDENNNIVNHIGKTSHYCVLPLVGIEDQLSEPIIVNSPDFEPDSERQSLMLSGQFWNEEKNVITETGINQKIYEQVFPLYEKLVAFLSEQKYGRLYYLAYGLDKANSHKNLDKEWYVPNVIHKYRDILQKYDVIKSYDGGIYKKLSDCIFVKETTLENESSVYSLLASLYPSKIVADNHEWSIFLWKSGLKLWSTEDLCADIESKENWDSINLVNTTLPVWYNKFLQYVYNFDVRYLTKYAVLPNMNGKFLKKDTENFQQGQNISTFVIDLLNKLGKDVKPILLHSDVTAVSLDSKYNSQSYSADINRLAKAIIDDSSQISKVSRLMPLISIIPNDEEKYSIEFRTQRKRFYEICTSLYSITDVTPSTDNSLLESAWKETDTWFVSHVLNSLKSLGSLSKLPIGLDAKWLNNTLLALNVQIPKLDIFEVLPNQEGNFCAHKSLYEDIEIPDVLKNDIFKSVDLNYKEILLHKDIDASAFSVNQNKTISSFSSDLKSKFATTSSYAYGNYFRGKYHYKPQEFLDKIALYIVSLLPKDKDSELYKYQKDLFYVSKEVLTNQTNTESDISFESSDLWQSANEYVCSQIGEALSSLGNLDTINTLLGQVGEAKVWEVLNKYYSFLSHANISYIDFSIFPNQNGVLKSFSCLYKDEGNIGDLLKNVISLLVDSDSEYRNILMDSHSCLQPQSVIGACNAYKLIDDKVYEYYQLPAKWEDNDYINAVHELIEVWKEQSGQFNDANFPKTKPIEDSIVLNVVWKKEKRELLMNVSSKLTDDQIQAIIENSAQIGELTDKVKQLEEENKGLQARVEELQNIDSILKNCHPDKLDKVRDLFNKLASEDTNIKDDDEIPLNDDDETDVVVVPKTYELEVEDFEGRLQTIRINQVQYAGLSLDEIERYVGEAKDAVVKYFRELNEKQNLGLQFDVERIAKHSYSQLYGIRDRNGNDIPIVVHSYKGPQYRYFDLNWYDWQLLSQKGAMLFVLTVTGLQCIPLYALPIRNFNISISNEMSKENRAALLTLAAVGKQYSTLGFDFGNNMPQGFNDPLPFDYVPEQLNKCISSIKEVCDRNIPQIANIYNSGKNIPLIRSSVGYSLAMEAVNEGNARDIFDAPANDTLAPSVGTSFID